MSLAFSMGSLNLERSRKIAWVVVLCALGVVLLALWQTGRTSEPRAIRQLSVEARHALYDRTLGTLRSSCDSNTRPAGLARHCREQAEFIVQFPECDDACRALASPHLERPTR